MGSYAILYQKVSSCKINILWTKWYNAILLNLVDVAMNKSARNLQETLNNKKILSILSYIPSRGDLPWVKENFFQAQKQRLLESVARLNWVMIMWVIIWSKVAKWLDKIKTLCKSCHLLLLKANCLSAKKSVKLISLKICHQKLNKEIKYS